MPQTPSDHLTDARRAAVARLVPLQPLLTDLGSVFAAAGHRLALVGGPVRDALLGRQSPDLDFTTDARPEETIRLLREWGDAHWDIGKAFGTIGARKGDHVVEVTTYRADVYREDSRKPEVAFGDTLEADLLRRDFTVNAMALELPALTFVDPYGGLEDLAARRLRTPGAPEVSFGDDPLRMMRGARFAAQLGFEVAPEAVAAMTAMAARISIVSAERIRVELEKLLLAPDPRPGLELLVSTGLAAQVLPELPALKLEIDEHHRHKDVYEHSLIVLEQAIALEDGPDGPVPGPDLVLRLAAILHDIGKPATRRFEAGGGVSFHHHEMEGAKLTTKRMKALRFDKDTTQQVSRLVQLHLRFHGYGDGAWTDSAVRRYVTDAGPLLDRLHKLTRSDCTTRNKRKAARLASAYDDLERRIAELREREELDAVRPDLDGNQIMEILGIPAGRDVGRAWKFLKELRLDRGQIGPDEAREELVAWWERERAATADPEGATAAPSGGDSTQSA
ncbi:CCA tRNA nucleotidyltransferase [Kineosporia rhizophila]|uniref:CCA tRNA nucleotidyltransferase n=1 Tax=Kineosporia rhizophila TaxID=84633 RepID=UPI001E409F09|nr:CCA tRNA nucleotidyltransferase [Kineosporia sp. NBRC 101677]MCE0534537.1 CCA tRNA nucleotidyltransferase [Kineosporia rhizophila]